MLCFLLSPDKKNIDCLELFPGGTAGSHSGTEKRTAGFKHLAFEVDDLDAAVSGLRADGIETDNIIDCSGVVQGLRVCFFSDPEGNRIEMMQGYRDQY